MSPVHPTRRDGPHSTQGDSTDSDAGGSRGRDLIFGLLLAAACGGLVYVFYFTH